LYFVTAGAGVPPESLPFEQPVKTSDAAKSKAPAAIETLFTRALPNTPPYTDVQGSLLLCSS